jgi:hypothetical protein
MTTSPPDPTFGEIVAETLPLVDAIPGYGPPVLVVVVPWLLLSLVLAGPFALVLTVVVVLVAAAALVGLVGAILAAPYLLVRQLRRRRAQHASMRAVAAAA